MRGGAEWWGRIRPVVRVQGRRRGGRRLHWAWVSLVVVFCLADFASAQEASARDSGSASFSEPVPQGSAAQTSAAEAKKPSAKKPSAENTSQGSATTPVPNGNSPKGAEATPGSARDGPANKPKAVPAAQGAQSSALDASTYRVRLRDLERRIEELKEQIRRSHTRLSLLSDHIMSGVDSGGRVDIQFDNDLSDAWRIVELVVVLDGIVQYKKADNTGALSAQKLIPIFNGSLGKGDHVVQVMMKLRGHGFGLFSYLRGLDATVRNDYSFSLSRGKAAEIRVTAWEQGGPTTSAEDRPNIRFNEMSAGGGAAPSRPAAGTPASPQ